MSIYKTQLNIGTAAVAFWTETLQCSSGWMDGGLTEHILQNQNHLLREYKYGFVPKFFCYFYAF
jgi:hypothetical protein